MKSAAFALALAALLVGSAAAGTAFGATEAVSLGSDEDTGPEPAPYLEPAAVENPVSFRIAYTATPVQPLETLAHTAIDAG